MILAITNNPASGGVGFYDSASWHLSNHQLTLNTYSHVAFIHNGTNIKTAVDGVTVLDEAATFHAITNPRMGANNGGAENFLDGDIDQLRIYPRTLTQAEITELANES